MYLLGSEELDFYWQKIEELLLEDRELWDRYHTKDSLMHKMLLGDVQVWAVSNKEVITAIMLSQVLHFDTGKVVQVFYAKGYEVLGALNNVTMALDKFALHIGAKRIAMVGRVGWVRALKKIGGDFEGMVISREVRPLGSIH